MRSILRRACLPILLAVGGAAMLVYGVKCHLISVVEYRETKVTIDIPSPFLPDEQSPDPGAPQFGGPPPPIKQTVTQIDRITIIEHEPAVTRDVTVGGVVLLASGEIKRTYDSSSGKGPALCPT
jgi:hypothetical protein